ncbi:hypothetical protein B566_EDAN007499 [Ephemera danica]|nr:hypothetical protein B566_EDAN007499 [Ephemera danica]
MGYSYYDSPEGQDCFPKLIYITKYSALAGLGVSTMDVLMFSHPQGYFNTISRFAHFTVPFVGMAAAFAATTCMATSLRHKDDKLNYFLGGVASGAVFGAWRRSGYAGFLACTALGVAGAIKKMSIEEGWTFQSQNSHSQTSSALGPRFDWTLAKDPAQVSK